MFALVFGSSVAVLSTVVIDLVLRLVLVFVAAPLVSVIELVVVEESMGQNYYSC